MHEWVLAEGLLRIVLQATRGRVKEIWVKIGELRQLDEEIFRFAFSSLSRGTRAEKAELKILTVPAKGKCPKCSTEFDLGSLAPSEKELVHFFPSIVGALGCTKCGNPRLQLESGKEFVVDSVVEENGL